MRGNLKLFKIFGIDVQLHISWWFVFALLTWSLAKGFFPLFYDGLNASQYWILGGASSLLLFISVLLHELSHSIVAMSRGIKVESITLFFFGGVAGITDENIKPRDEFLMAIAGPLFSFALAGLFYFVFVSVSNIFINAITFYLYQLNLILAIFNFVPAFPLDGGRAFRAILHAKTKDLKRSTKIASNGGKFFAWFLIIVGVFQIFNGLGGGLWLIFLGAFLHFIANVSYEQVVVREKLSKWKVKDLMTTDLHQVKAEQRFSDFLKTHKKDLQKYYLVTRGQRSAKKIVGILSLAKIESIGPGMQRKVKISQIMFPIKKLKTVSPDVNAYQGFKQMMSEKGAGIPVKELGKNGKVLGVLEQEKLMQALMWHNRFGVEFSKQE